MAKLRQCQGGPLSGQQVPVRFPLGFILVNRPVGQVIIYRVNALGICQARDAVTEHVLKRRLAALRDEWDVIAYDPERMGPWAQ